MDKPRFPVSVTREFSYRADLSETGEILEADDFKSLYHHVLYDLRNQIGSVANRQHDWSFPHVSAVIEFGYRTDYYTDPGHCYSEWTSLKTCCYIYVSLYTVSIHNWNNDTKCKIERK